MGKHNNATTGFAALARKTNPRIAGSQLKHMREKGQVEEGSIVDGVWTADPPKKGQPDVPAPSEPDGGILNKKTPPAAAAASRAEPPIFRKADGTDANPPGFVRPPPGVIFNEPSTKDKKPKAAARNLPEADMDESAFQAAIGKKKYGDQGMKALQKAGRNNASDTTMNNIRNRYDKYDESMGQADEGNAFSGAVVRAKRDGIQPGEKINVGGKEYPVKEAAKYRDPKYKDKLYTQEPPDYTYGPDMDDAYYNPKPDDYAGRKRPMGGSGGTDPLEKGFGRSGTGSAVEKGPRKGLPKRDQITSLKGSIKDARGTHKSANFADRIAGAKKEVDEMLGNVAADAMKKAIGGGRGRNAEMDESGGHIDWSDLERDDQRGRRSNTSGTIVNNKPGSTVHYAGKNYSGAGHDVGAGSDGPSGPAGRPRVGAGQGTKIGAKINTGKSKLMTREGDQDPADQGEYDQEGAMGRNEIHTMMRNAKQLEQMLGDNDNLPEWVQKNLSLASDYMQTIADYLASEKETDAEDQSGEEIELAEKKSARTKPKQSSGNDGNLANNAKPYDKVTRGDVVAGRLGKDEMGGKKKSAKKEEEVEESTTAGSVATAPTSSKASKGGMSFGQGIYDSIDRAVERQINESMNISMSMNNEGSGAGQTLTITATDEDATQLAQMLKMAGLGGGAGMSHGEDDLADQIRQAEQGHGGAAFGGEEVCAGCGMSSCGCDEIEQMDEGTVDKMIKFMQNRLGTAAEKAASNTASDAYMAANGEANFRKLIDKLESDPAKYKYTGSPKTTRLPYMGPPKDIEDPAASAFKSYYEPGTATPTNRIPTIDKPPQMRRSTDRPAFDQSVRQTAVRDPFDPLVDESYGDNVVDMNSPNYPTNTESAQDNFGYSGGVNKPKRDVAGNGQTTVPVTAVRGQDNDFQESIQRMREIAGIKETPSIFFPDPRDTAKQLGIKAQSRLIDTPTPMSTGNNRGYTNTFLDPAQKAQQRLSKQNESIFTDTANLWKSYKG